MFGLVLYMIFTILALAVISLDLRLTLISSVCILNTILSNFSVIMLMGWNLGLSENLALIVFMGVSVQYIVYLTWSYKTEGSTK